MPVRRVIAEYLVDKESIRLMSGVEIYKDNQAQIEVRFEGDAVWLIQEQMVSLFERDQSVISRHIKNVFKEGELDQKSNMQKKHIGVRV